MHHLIIAQISQAAPPQTVPPAIDVWGNVITLVLLFAGIYFLLIKPQQEKEKEMQKLMKELKKGDEVITAGGIIGTVEKLTEDTAEVCIADKVVVTFQRSAIQAKTQPEETQPTGQKTEKKA